MQPLNGPGMPDRYPPSALPGGKVLIEGQPLSTLQRSNLDLLITKIAAISAMKPAEIAALLRHELTGSRNSELLSQHYQPAEKWLQQRLAITQQPHTTRPLLMQLSELLSQGNNRQTVSDFIRQQFGYTQLTQLSQPQLQQVLNLLQTDNSALPPRILNSERLLLPVEQQHLQQQITQLSTTTGEAPAKIWQSVFKLLGTPPEAPLSARHFLLISHFLETKIALGSSATLALSQLFTLPKPPPNPQEQQLLNDYCHTRFNNQPSTPLTHSQLHEVIDHLFARRLRHAEQESLLQHQPLPLWHPLLMALPTVLPPALGKPTLWVAVIIVLLLFWLLC